MKTPKILIVAGGTGGHLYPGIAVAQALWSAPVPDGGHRPQIRFVVRRGDLGKDILAREGFDVLEIAGQGLPRRLNSGALAFPLTFLRSWRETLNLLTQERPDAVLGMGGYLSFPVLSAAAWRKIPTLIHEQNAVPGLANRLLARWVDSVAVSFPGSEAYFSAKKVWLSGLPVRAGFHPMVTTQARAALGLAPDIPTFFAFGGSLGAHALNYVFLDVWQRLMEAGRRFQVLQVTGPRDFEAFERLFAQSKIPGRVLPYCHEMPLAYGAADLVLARSGASTIAELLAAQRPAYLIPYPYATHDHQWSNAQILVRQGVAEAIREHQLKAQDLSACLIHDLKHPQELLERQKRYAGLDANGPEALPAVTIAKHILKQAGV